MSAVGEQGFKDIVVDGQSHSVEILEIPGEEDLLTRRIDLRRADGFIYVISEPETPSHSDMGSLLYQAQSIKGSSMSYPTVVVVSKSDLVKPDTAPPVCGWDFEQMHSAMSYETSAKLDTDVEAVFIRAVREVEVDREVIRNLSQSLDTVFPEMLFL